LRHAAENRHTSAASAFDQWIHSGEIFADELNLPLNALRQPTPGYLRGARLT
jgi:hypothetical protein